LDHDIENLDESPEPRDDANGRNSGAIGGSGEEVNNPWINLLRSKFPTT